mgnify:CR=1 FL=1
MNRTKRLLTATVAAAFAGLQSFAGNDLTMIVGTYTDQSTSEGMYCIASIKTTERLKPSAASNRAIRRFLSSTTMLLVCIPSMNTTMSDAVQVHSVLTLPRVSFHSSTASIAAQR